MAVQTGLAEPTAPIVTEAVSLLIQLVTAFPYISATLQFVVVEFE